jgi:hypothetical protein
MLLGTVGELIAELQKYPADLRVLATWEGTLRGFDVQGVEDVRKWEGGKSVPSGQALVLDVEHLNWPYDFPNAGDRP